MSEGVWLNCCHLVNEGPPVAVGLQQDAGPQLRVLAANKITGQTLEQRVLVAHLRHGASSNIQYFKKALQKHRICFDQGVFPYINQLLVTLSPFISHTGQVGVSFLTVLAHHAAVVVGVLPQEAFGVVVAVDIDLGQGIVGGGLFAAFMNASLQPGQQQLQSGERKSERFPKEKKRSLKSRV